jgi:hypothetical protein
LLGFFLQIFKWALREDVPLFFDRHAYSCPQYLHLAFSSPNSFLTLVKWF